MKHDAVVWADARLSRLVARLRADHVNVRFGAVGALARALDGVEDRAARELFSRLAERLRRHLTREEHVVFPLITLMEQASLQHSELPPQLERGLHTVIEELVREHEQIGRLVDELKSCSGVGPRIAELETALRECMHLEDAVLYPRAIALEKRLYPTTPQAAERSPDTTRSHAEPPPPPRRRRA